MYIRELHVDGYGPLQNVSMSLDAPVTVVFGPNEAGKSTLLRFIRSMLYGIPTRKEPVERGEPMGGGRHGGRMNVHTADGRELVLERYADGPAGRRTGGGLVLRDGNGTEHRWTQAEWERHVLGGISERLFRQLFAVSLDELHELLTLQGEEIGNFLYHAGLAGGASLADARRRLGAEMDKLYRPRGQTQEMNRLLVSIKEMEAAVRQSRNGLAAYQETKEELSRTNERLAELDRTLPPLAAKAAELNGALQLREWWFKLRTLQAEEHELSQRLPDPAAPPLPEEAAAEWAGLLRTRQAALERLEKANQTVLERRSALESLRWDEPLLERIEELEKLEAMREAAAARQEEKEAVAAELLLLEESIGTLLTRLSPEWNDGDLHGFVPVTSEREPLKRLQAAWAEAERDRERLEADAGRLKRQRDALLAEIGETGRAENARLPGVDADLSAASPFGAFRPASRDSLQQAWNSLEDELRRMERNALLGSAAPGARGSAPRSHRQQQPGPSWPALAVSAATGIPAAVLAFIGLSASDGAAVYMSGSVLLAAAAGAAGWIGIRGITRSRSSQSKEQHLPSMIAESRRRSEELLRQLLVRSEPAAAVLLAGAAVDEEVWIQLRKAVQDRMAVLDRAESENERVRERHRRLAVLDREKEALEAEIHHTLTKRDELFADWSAWLHRYKLPLSLTPDSLPELLHLAEQGQSALRRRAKALERAAALEQMQAAFRETAAALFRDCPPPPAMEADPALSVTWLYRRAAEQRALKEEAQRAERSRIEAEKAENEARQALAAVNHEIARKAADAGSDSEPAYELRLQIDDRRRILLRERKEIGLRLEAGRTADSAEALYRLLETHDEAALTLLCRQAEEARQAADDFRSGLLDKRGRLTQELERLRTEAETEERMLLLSEMESKLERLIERYAILALSDKLLQETKAVFEEERQPEVLRLASRYFSTMTGGVYSRITAPGDTPSILVESEDRRVTDSAFLSRGTQEQLYLSMRFALAEAASRDIPLPLLLDDLFVHFDGNRLHRTVPVLGDMSRNRQVIVFTCHRHVAEAIAQGLPAARIMAWGEGARFEAPGPAPSGTASPD